MKLDDKSIDIIESFVARTLGKGFELTLGKLFQFNSTLKRSEQEEQAKTYFCSELVARLYKEMGLLDPEKSSTQYYPVDFSDSGNLKLKLPDSSLGNEVYLSFDAPPKR